MDQKQLETSHVVNWCYIKVQKYFCIYLTFLNLGILFLRLIGHLCHCQKQKKISKLKAMRNVTKAYSVQSNKIRIKYDKMNSLKVKDVLSKQWPNVC